MRQRRASGTTLLAGLRELPAAMHRVLALQPEIAEAARRLAPSRRYWAVVGNGPNTVAAEEIRIKLSELCYKSIACDVTEDKKHIDLSSEPLILVCAAGLVGSTADDVAKEVAIYRAHKAAPVVIATEGEERFRAAPAVHHRAPASSPSWPSCCRPWSATCSATRPRWPSTRWPGRCARRARSIEHAVGTRRTGADELLDGLRDALEPAGPAVLGRPAQPAPTTATWRPSTAVRAGRSLLRDVAGERAARVLPARVRPGRPRPAVLVDDLTAALSRAIEELTRPVDAIKHQAKTVTVGHLPLRRGAARPAPRAGRPGRRGAPRAAGLHDAALAGRPRPGGASRGRVHPLRHRRRPGGRHGHHRDRRPRRRVARACRRGSSATRSSRAPSAGWPWSARSLVARGRSDGRTVLMVPEVKGSQCTGITLRARRCSPTACRAPVARAVLQGWDRRYDRLVDWVTETEGGFRDDLLAEIPVIDLLTVPVSDLAERWLTPWEASSGS